MGKRVQVFQVSDAPDPVFITQPVAGQAFGYRHIAGIRPQYRVPPPRLDSLGDGLRRGRDPVTVPGRSGAQQPCRHREVPVRLEDLGEHVLVREQFRTQQVQQDIKVVPVDLNRSRRKHQDRLGRQAQALDELIRPGPWSSQVVGFVSDDQVELGWRLQFQQPSVAPRTVRAYQVRLHPEQLIMHDRPRVLMRPLALVSRLIKAVPQRLGGEDAEVLVETAHLSMPLEGQGLRAEDQYTLEPLTGRQFLKDQSCFDGLAHTDIVGDQEPRPISTQEAKQGLELKRDELDPRRAQRVDVIDLRIIEAHRRQPGPELQRIREVPL